MKNKKICVLLLFLLVYVFECNAQKIVVKPFPNNPTSYIFKVNIDDARFILAKSFYKYSSSKFHVIDNVFYYGCPKKLSWWPIVAKNALCNKDNQYDIWMQMSVDSSDIYFNKIGNPFAYEMECIVHFTAIDNNTTKMEIDVLNAKIHLRDRWLPSPPHFVNNPVYKTVKSTSIEEYKILQCMGGDLGVIDQMPALKL
jgi:hypothetical protein